MGGGGGGGVSKFGLCIIPLNRKKSSQYTLFGFNIPNGDLLYLNESLDVIIITNA